MSVNMRHPIVSLVGVCCPSYRFFLQIRSHHRPCFPYHTSTHAKRIWNPNWPLQGTGPVSAYRGPWKPSKTCPIFRHPVRGATTPQHCRSLHSYFIQNERQARSRYSVLRKWVKTQFEQFRVATTKPRTAIQPGHDQRQTRGRKTFHTHPSHEKWELSSARFITATIKMCRTTYSGLHNPHNQHL